jgi:hypothetical protein
MTHEQQVLVNKSSDRPRNTHEKKYDGTLLEILG